MNTSKKLFLITLLFSVHSSYAQECRLEKTCDGNQCIFTGKVGDIDVQLKTTRQTRYSTGYSGLNGQVVQYTDENIYRISGEIKSGGLKTSILEQDLPYGFESSRGIINVCYQTTFTINGNRKFLSLTEDKNKANYMAQVSVETWNRENQKTDKVVCDVATFKAAAPVSSTADKTKDWKR